MNKKHYKRRKLIAGGILLALLIGLAGLAACGTTETPAPAPAALESLRLTLPMSQS